MTNKEQLEIYRDELREAVEAEENARMDLEEAESQHSFALERVEELRDAIAELEEEAGEL